MVIMVFVKRTLKQRRRQESTRMDLRRYSWRNGNHKNYNRFLTSRKSGKSAQNNQRKLEQQRGLLEKRNNSNGRIMCYFTKKVLNKRFLPNRKNRWNPPVCTDERFRYVEVECGHCFECRKKKRREWRIRNYEQLKETPHAVFFHRNSISTKIWIYLQKIWI